MNQERYQQEIDKYAKIVAEKTKEIEDLKSKIEETNYPTPQEISDELEKLKAKSSEIIERFVYKSEVLGEFPKTEVLDKQAESPKMSFWQELYSRLFSPAPKKPKKRKKLGSEEFQLDCLWKAIHSNNLGGNDVRDCYEEYTGRGRTERGIDVFDNKLAFGKIVSPVDFVEGLHLYLSDDHPLKKYQLPEVDIRRDIKSYNFADIAIRFYREEEVGISVDHLRDENNINLALEFFLKKLDPMMDEAKALSESNPGKARYFWYFLKFNHERTCEQSLQIAEWIEQTMLIIRSNTDIPKNLKLTNFEDLVLFVRKILAEEAITAGDPQLELKDSKIGKHLLLLKGDFKELAQIINEAKSLPRLCESKCNEIEYKSQITKKEKELAEGKVALGRYQRLGAAARDLGLA